MGRPIPFHGPRDGPTFGTSSATTTASQPPTSGYSPTQLPTPTRTSPATLSLLTRSLPPDRLRLFLSALLSSLSLDARQSVQHLLVSGIPPDQYDQLENSSRLMNRRVLEDEGLSDEDVEKAFEEGIMNPAQTLVSRLAFYGPGRAANVQGLGTQQQQRRQQQPEPNGSDGASPTSASPSSAHPPNSAGSGSESGTGSRTGESLLTSSANMRPSVLGEAHPVNARLERWRRMLEHLTAVSTASTNSNNNSTATDTTGTSPTGTASSTRYPRFPPTRSDFDEGSPNSVRSAPAGPVTTTSGAGRDYDRTALSVITADLESALLRMITDEVAQLARATMTLRDTVDAHLSRDRNGGRDPAGFRVRGSPTDSGTGASTATAQTNDSTGAPPESRENSNNRRRRSPGWEGEIDDIEESSRRRTRILGISVRETVNIPGSGGALRGAGARTGQGQGQGNEDPLDEFVNFEE